MAANLVRSVARHQANDEAANYWNENHVIAKMMMLGRLKRRGKLPKKGKICDRCNKPDEDPRYDRAQRADDQRHSGKQDNPPVASKICKPIFQRSEERRVGKECRSRW